MKKKYYLTLRNVTFILMISMLPLCSCSTVSLGLLPESASQSQKNAERLYINGEFDKALKEYEVIYQAAVLPKDRNLALYGIGCTQLMLASNDEDFVQAVKHLLRWNANKGSDPFIENRHLLILALKQQSDLLQQKNDRQAAREEYKNRVIAFQKKKISQMAATLEALNKQLEELESIDETFQEIRNPQ